MMERGIVGSRPGLAGEEWEHSPVLLRGFILGEVIRSWQGGTLLFVVLIYLFIFEKMS